jgi:heat shock protein HtpX
MRTRQHWYKDPRLQARMFLVMALLFALYMAFIAVLFVARVPIGFIALFAGGLAIFQYFTSDKLVVASMGAKQVTPAQAPELHAMIDRLAQAMDLPKPKVYMMDTPVPNAFATGRNPKNAVVCVTTGIMGQLNEREMLAVLGHELAHVKNRDVLVMSLASFFATVAGFITQWGLFLGMGGGRDRDRGAGPVMLVYLASVAVSLISTLILIPALSRQRELAADRGSATYLGTPGDLISALMKISGRMNQIPTQDLRRVESANAFFIVPALKGVSVRTLTSTHPSLEERVAQLQEIQRRMEGIA